MVIMYEKTWTLGIILSIVSTCIFKTLEANNCLDCALFLKKSNLWHGATENLPKFVDTIEQETDHEINYNHMNYIAEAMLDLQNYAHSQHVDHIERIQNEIIQFFKIINIFNAFHTVDGLNKFNMIGSKVQLLRKNRVKNIILKLINARFAAILSKKLRAFASNIKSKLRNRRAIIEISTNKLRVNKLIIHKSIFCPHKNSSIVFLNGRINVHRLIIGALQNKHNPARKRVERKTVTFLQLDSSKIFCKTVNRVVMDRFMTGLFRNGIKTVVNGDVSMVGKAEHVYLTVDWIDDLLGSDLITTSTDQVIEGNVYVSEILANEVNARIFNDLLHFYKNVVLLGNNSAIESRVKIAVCDVEESMRLSDNEGIKITESIVGSHLDDFIQIYNGRILIKGGLNIKNIFVDEKIIVNNIKFDLFNQYWLKNIDQIVSSVIFALPVVSPQATLSINGYSFVQLFLLDDDSGRFIKEKTLLFIIFEANVNVILNISTDTSSNHSLQEMISNTIDRLEDAQIKLNENVIFKEGIVVNTLGIETNFTKFIRTLHINDIGLKQYSQNMFLHGHIILGYNIPKYSKINGLNEYRNATHMLSYIQCCKMQQTYNVTFHGNFDVSHASIGNLESIEHIFRNIPSAHEQQISLLVLEGYILLRKNTLAKDINTIDPDVFFTSIVHNVPSLKRKTIDLGGSISFKSDINICFSNIIEFNKQTTVKRWFEASFRQQWTKYRTEQRIHNAGYQFISMISDNCDVIYSINDIYVTALFTSEYRLKKAVIKSDISFASNVRIKTKLRCSHLRPCEPKTIHLSQTMWDTMSIIANVQLLTPGKFDFLELALSSRANTTIRSDTVLQTKIGRIVLNRLKSSDIASINSINFIKIFIDALLVHANNIHKKINIYSEKQLIGIETFCESYIFRVFYVQIINDVDIQHLNDTIMVRTKISLFSWQRIQFLTDILSQSVQMIKISDIYFVSDNDHFNPIISFAESNSIIAQVRIDVESINGFSNGFSWFMENRLKLKVISVSSQFHEMIDGFLTIEKLILENKIQISQINDAAVDELVLLFSNTTQHLSDYREFKNIYINKPFHLWKLNSIELVKAFSKSISLDLEESIKKVVINKSIIACSKIGVLRSFNRIVY